MYVFALNIKTKKLVFKYKPMSQGQTQFYSFFQISIDNLPLCLLCKTEVQLEVV